MQGGNTTVSGEPQIQWTAEETRLLEVVKNYPNDIPSSLQLINTVFCPSNFAAEKVIKVYESFLKRFPLSVRHRNHYADCLIGFERREDALKLYEGKEWPVSCSVEFWEKYHDIALPVRDYDYMHRLFHSAILSVGSHPGSFSLYNLSIKYELKYNQWNEVSWLYSQAFANPVKGVDVLFDSFKELCWTINLQDLMGWLDKLNYSEDDSFGKLPYADKVNSYIKDKKDEAAKLEGEITEFESHITRSDFDVEQAEDEFAVGVWHAYIDFLERKHHPERVKELFKRCLVPCVTRTDLWLRYAEYLEDKEDGHAAVHALNLAFSYVKEAPMELFLFYAGLKERMKDFAGVRDLYSEAKNIFKHVPLKVFEAHANFEHRLGNNVGAAGVFQDELDAEIRNGSGLFSPALRLKYARFALVVLGDPNKSKEILTGLLDLELSTPVVEGIIDIASALPEKERTEFLDSLDCVMKKFVLAEASNEILSEISDKIDISLKYLQFVDYFGQDDAVKMATGRHLSRFRRSHNLLPKRRLEAEIDSDIHKKMKIDAVSGSDKMLDAFIISLPEFLSKHASALTEVKTLNVGALKGLSWTRLTEIGRRLLKAIYKALLQRHGCMLSWNGVFRAEDIMVTYDVTSSSIICSFRKEASRVNGSWIAEISNDHIKLQKILKSSFKSITRSYPPYLEELFTFAKTPKAACDIDKGTRDLFLRQISHHPALKSSSARMSLCRELFLFIKENKLWSRGFDPCVVSSNNAAYTSSTTESSDNLVKAVCVTTVKMIGPRPDPASSWLISVIRHIETHSIDHLQALSMSINGVEDLYDLIDYHYSKFIQTLVMDLFEFMIRPDCYPRLFPIMDKYMKSD